MVNVRLEHLSDGKMENKGLNFQVLGRYCLRAFSNQHGFKNSCALPSYAKNGQLVMQVLLLSWCLVLVCGTISS